jgi:hypothetical protein
MLRQFFLTLVLRLIKYLFGVILIPVPEPQPTLLDNEEEGWYVNSWGLITRDR